MKKEMKKVIITGGLGFIGSHLVERLLAKGLETIVVDNKLTNVVDENFFNNERCKVITKSIEDTNLDNIKEIDTVFHLASILGPIGVLKYAGEIGISTLRDTVKIRDYCIDNNAFLIDISTSEVYGHQRALKEDSEKIFPGKYKVRSEYGAGKMLSEMALINKAKVDERLRFHLIRPFNVAGSRQKPDGGFVLPRFVISALTGQPLTVYDDGTQRRAFTDVQDICDAILEITNSDYENEIWNIGNSKNEMTIKKMAELVIDVVKEKYPNKNPEMVFVDPKKIHGPLFEETVEKIPYVKKINSLLGWEAKMSAKSIFREVVDFYDEKIRNGYYFKTM